MSELLIVHCSQLVTLAGPQRPRTGTEMCEVGALADGAMLVRDGRIAAIGLRADVEPLAKDAEVFDAGGRLVTPGFVDAHTHLVFAGNRANEFEMRCAGATYQEIAGQGGGIRSTVRKTRAATEDDLVRAGSRYARWFLQGGTTTVEAKSGYGLSLESELKSLEAIRDAAARWPGTVVATLLGAHAVPKEFQGRGDEYVHEVCEKMIPEAAKQKLAQFVDVFTERAAFSVENTARIFEAAKKHGLGVRAHVGQLSETPLQPLLRYNPASFDHVDQVSDVDIRTLAQQDTIATLVPGANYFLGLEKFPPARKLIEAGVPVALATDYNPGSSPTPSMPFVLSLACTHMKMSPAEAISAATINGAWALRLSDRKGSIEHGKDADFAVFEADDYREIPYWFASNRCAFTVLNGTVIASAGSAVLG